MGGPSTLTADFGIRAASQIQARFSTGEFPAKQITASSSLRLANQITAPASIQLAAQRHASYSIWITIRITAPFSVGIFANRQLDASWNLSISASLKSYFSLGYIRSRQIEAQWGTPIVRMLDAQYAMPLRWQLTAPWGLRVAKRTQEQWAITIGAELNAPITNSMCTILVIKWSIHSPVARQTASPYTSTEPVASHLFSTLALLDHNLIRTGMVVYWDLTPDVTMINATSPATMDHPGSSPVQLLATDIGIAEGEYAWTGRMEVASIWNFQRLAVDDPVTLSVGGENYALLIDNRTLSRSGGDQPRMEISGVSTSASLTPPRAVPFEKHWFNTVQARDAAEEAVGAAIVWDLLDWLIPVGRLSVYNAARLEVVRTIAQAAGGVVETMPNGTLRVRHLFPISVPDWNDATPDHVLTDTAHNLSITESHRFRKRVNRVSIRDYLPTTGFLSAELDGREDGLNLGRTSFSPGSTPHLLVHAGSEVTISGADASAGSLSPGAAQVFQVEENVVFSGSDQARLSKPAQSLDSWIWMGRDLGSLSLASNKMTISATSAGLAVARLKYTIQTSAWGLSSPSTMGSQETFPIQVRVTGTNGDTPGSGEAIFQRGDGEFPGGDISELLLSGLLAKQSRGRAEIDAGEALQEVSLTCIHRPGIMPGDLAEVHDALMGKSWKGKVVGVSHTTQGPVTTTSLDLVRYVPIH